MTSGKPMRERLKALYLSGFAFAALHPALAELGNRFAAETSRVVTEPVLKDANEPSSNLFLSLILEAQAVGEIRKEFSVNAILMLLFSVNAQIAEAVKHPLLLRAGSGQQIVLNLMDFRHHRFEFRNGVAGIVE